LTSAEAQKSDVSRNYFELINKVQFLKTAFLHRSEADVWQGDQIWADFCLLNDCLLWAVF
jgi:hypothetical protein